MAKYSIKFDGQHSDEIVLYTVHEHPIVVMASYIKVALAAGVALISTMIAAGVLPDYSGLIMGFGWLLTFIIGAGGAWVVHSGEDKNVAYITDRRIVRFHASSPFTVNTRALAWDEAVKVKTYSPNFIWRTMNVGTVVVHAKSTVLTTQETRDKNAVTDDDVEIDNVYYYRDLGNYIDKLLYLNRSDRKKLKEVKPFVPKPRGKRD